MPTGTVESGIKYSVENTHTAPAQFYDLVPLKRAPRSTITELLPADYCQLELVLCPAGKDLETGWKRGNWLTGKALIRKTRELERRHYCQLGKLAVKLDPAGNWHSDRG